MCPRGGDMAWNKPSEGAAKPTPKKPSAMRGIVAGAVVVCAAVAAFYFLFSADWQTLALWQ